MAYRGSIKKGKTMISRNRGSLIYFLDVYQWTSTRCSKQTRKRGELTNTSLPKETTLLVKKIQCVLISFSQYSPFIIKYICEFDHSTVTNFHSLNGKVIKNIMNREICKSLGYICFSSSIMHCLPYWRGRGRQFSHVIRNSWQYLDASWKWDRKADSIHHSP